MPNELHVFISSKMQELAPERQLLHDLLPRLGNDLVRLRAWVFESDAPAADASIREVYLNALKHSALYIGLFWKQYGEWTVDEFQRATEWGIDRHIYVKNVDADQREAALTAFLDTQSDVVSGITPKWFTTLDDLREQVQKSIEVWLQDRLMRHPGDHSALLVEFSDDLGHRLPKRLIGRDVLLRDVRALLDEGERVLLQGFGGMGKSALAAAVAGAWADDNRGKVLWLRVGSDEADSLFEALARPFDAQQAIANAPGNDRARAIRQVLTEGAVSLIVLDDVWNGAALNQVLRGIPRKIPVLITARQRYAVDHILEVGRLDPVDALRLLGHYAGQAYAETDAGAREICHQLGYHAFALEVAGKTIKVDRITPADLMARIAAAPHEIAMPEDFAEEGRTSITELLTASVYALDESARQAFLALGGMFVPSATPGLLSRCMNRPLAAVDEALTTLQRRGLAERVPESENSLAYYRIHDLAYSFARQVGQRQPMCAPEAVITTCQAYAAEHEADLRALEAELGNILGAADFARRGDSPTTQAALIAIMRALCGPYLSTRGHSLRFVDLLDAAIAAAEASGPDQDEARLFLLGKRGNTYYDRGQLDHALRCYQGALALAESLGLRHLETLLLCNVSKVLADQDDPGAAANFERAYQIASELEDMFLVGYVLEHQGYYAQARGDYAAARGYFAEEVALAEYLNDPETTFFALLNLGSVDYHLGDFAGALVHHRRALSLAETGGNRIWMAYALQSMGEDHHRLAEHEPAKTCFQRALALFRESGMQAKIAEVENYMRTADYPIPAG